MRVDIAPEPPCPGSRRRRALRWPPPDFAEVVFTPLPVAGPGEPLTAAQQKARKALLLILSPAPEISPCLSSTSPTHSRSDSPAAVTC